MAVIAFSISLCFVHSEVQIYLKSIITRLFIFYTEINYPSKFIANILSAEQQTHYWGEHMTFFILRVYMPDYMTFFCLSL